MGTRAMTMRSSLWFIPVLCVLAGVTVSIGTIAIDRWFDYELLPRWVTGGPGAAVAILETVAVSMVSLTALGVDDHDGRRAVGHGPVLTANRADVPP